ncbi:helical backbone metal receptor, partial [Streptomyces sp. NPDC127574]|uniref:helical backbone metal receptor n=1 Tax=Streptomyces sp. NPDC127574 TaxID=3345401 RepID=UPI00363B2955
MAPGTTGDAPAAGQRRPKNPRVISLVPSLTEAVAVSLPGVLVAATDWCTHPAGLDVERIGGTKNPDVDAVVRLAPDLVVANEEENREPDLAALRRAGI